MIIILDDIPQKRKEMPFFTSFFPFQSLLFMSFLPYFLFHMMDPFLSKLARARVWPIKGTIN